LVLVGISAGLLATACTSSGPIGPAGLDRNEGTDGSVLSVSGPNGCTPGFWRQEHHYVQWPFSASPSHLWTDLFVDPDGQFDGLTLGEVVEERGGGVHALGRHAVAAYLNALNINVDYPLSASEVQDLVNAAMESGDYETAKNVLAGYNELGCPINNNSPVEDPPVPG